MAFVNTPIAFSGSADKGMLQIKPADVYVGTLDPATHEITGSKYIGYTNQQLALSITQEEQEYKQNGVAVLSQPISKAATAKFRLDQWDAESFAFALGLSSYSTDAVSGTKRIIISADNITPKDWFIQFKTETVDGDPLEFSIPCGNVNVDGDINFGGGNDSPNFGGLSVMVKALAADVNSDAGVVSALAFYDFKYSNVAVSGVSGIPAALAIGVAEEVILTPTVAPANATDTRVTWTSSAPAKATVSSAGKVVGVAAGPTTVTVTTVDGSFTDTCTVTVS